MGRQRETRNTPGGTKVSEVPAATPATAAQAEEAIRRMENSAQHMDDVLDDYLNDVAPYPAMAGVTVIEAGEQRPSVVDYQAEARRANEEMVNNFRQRTGQ